MKKLLTFVFMALVAISAWSDNGLTLRYDRPADYWLEALPLGNGRLGAMVYGGIASDTIQINEDTFWSGSPYNNYNPNAKAHLQEIRDCIDRGDYERRRVGGVHPGLVAVLVGLVPLVPVFLGQGVVLVAHEKGVRARGVVPLIILFRCHS